jgi:hypothetical protein
LSWFDSGSTSYDLLSPVLWDLPLSPVLMTQFPPEPELSWLTFPPPGHMWNRMLFLQPVGSAQEWRDLGVSKEQGGVVEGARWQRVQSSGLTEVSYAGQAPMAPRHLESRNLPGSPSTLIEIQ